MRCWPAARSERSLADRSGCRAPRCVCAQAWRPGRDRRGLARDGRRSCGPDLRLRAVQRRHECAARTGAEACAAGRATGGQHRRLSSGATASRAARGRRCRARCALGRPGGRGLRRALRDDGTLARRALLHLGARCVVRPVRCSRCAAVDADHRCPGHAAPHRLAAAPARLGSAAQPGGRNLFVKPKSGAATPNNLAVVTDRRTHAFRFVVLADGDAKPPVYRLVVKAPAWGQKGANSANVASLST